jgi:hypothetical protein
MPARLDLDEEEICRLYWDEKVSPTEIAKRFNCSRQTILRRLEKYGRPKGERRFHVHHKPYENYFLDVTKPEQAWILGWIAADGHLEKTNHKLVFGLQLKDSNILERFSQEFEGTKVRYNNKDCRLTFGNKKLIEDIIKAGIPKGAKSKSIKPLDLPKNLMSHFWRGVWEGDGSIGIWKQLNYYYPVINLTGNNMMCEGLRDFLKVSTKIAKDGNSYKFLKRSTEMNFWQNLYNCFYDSYTLEKGIYLKRKHDKFLEIFDFLENR